MFFWKKSEEKSPCQGGGNFWKGSGGKSPPPVGREKTHCEKYNLREHLKSVSQDINLFEFEWENVSQNDENKLYIFGRLRYFFKWKKKNWCTFFLCCEPVEFFHFELLQAFASILQFLHLDKFFSLRVHFPFRSQHSK